MIYEALQASTKAGTALWPPGHSARDIPDATVPQEKRGNPAFLQPR